MLNNKFIQLKTLITEQFKQGVSPKPLILGIVTTLCVSVLPLLGSTTFLIWLLGRQFKWNHVISQSINYLMYPIQLILFLPQIQLGRWLMGAPSLQETSQQLKILWATEKLVFLKTIALQQLYGLLFWALWAVPVVVVTFFIVNKMESFLRSKMSN